MPEMIATSEIEYPPGKKWMPGDRFPVEDAHVEILRIAGRAKLPDDPQVTPTLKTESGLQSASVRPQVATPRPRGRPPKAR